MFRAPGHKDHENCDKVSKEKKVICLRKKAFKMMGLHPGVNTIKNLIPYRPNF